MLSDVREETELDGRPTARDTPGSNLNKGVLRDDSEPVTRFSDMFLLFQTDTLFAKLLF